MAKLLLLAEFTPFNNRLIKSPQSREEEFYYQSYHLKIFETLKELNVDFDSTSNIDFFIQNHSKYDLVWSLYNRIGFRNSEIFVQTLCEYFGIKYIGAAPNIRALSEDKSMSKLLAEHLNIKTAKWVIASKEYPLDTTSPFPAPYFVKPRFGSASIGIDESCMCYTWNDAIAKAEEFFSRNIEIIVEEFIDGVYYSVPVINTISKKPIIAVPHYQLSNKKGNVITYPQKRLTEDGMQRYLSNDKILNKKLISSAGKLFLEMQPCDYARFDYIVEKVSGIPYFLESNVLMNLGISSGFAQSFCETHFPSYKEIIRHILELGLAKL